MEIKVLGSGCKNCVALEAHVRQSLDTLGVEASIDKVTDYGEIAAYGVMSTPALVVDDIVVLAGRVPSVEDLGRILTGVKS